MKLPGNGSAGTSGGSTGALVLTIQVQEHPALISLEVVAASGLVLRRQITPDDFGKTLSVPSLNGDLQVEVPIDKSSFPASLVIPNAGLFDPARGVQGDATVILSIAE